MRHNSFMINVQNALRSLSIVCLCLSVLIVDAERKRWRKERVCIFWPDNNRPRKIVITHIGTRNLFCGCANNLSHLLYSRSKWYIYYCILMKFFGCLFSFKCLIVFLLLTGAVVLLVLCFMCRLKVPLAIFVYALVLLLRISLYTSNIDAIR